MSLKDFLKAVLELGKDEVFKVDVMPSFSFFNTDKTIEGRVLDFFKDFTYQGRYINVEITENKGQGRSGQGNRGGKRNDRSSRGRKKGFDGAKGSRSKRSKSDRPRRSRRR
jgi:ATP-dependent RNA helicase DeaD